MNAMRFSFLLVIIFLSQAMGCGYVKDRLKDASEMLELAGGISVGMEVNARATKVFQTGFGSYDGDWAGLREGLFASWEEQRVEMGISPFFYHEVFRESDTLLNIQHPLFGDPGFSVYMNDFNLFTDRGFFEVGLTANLIVLGLDVAVEGAEIADFLFGWFGWDLLHDDCYSRTLEELVIQARSVDPYRRAAAVRGLRRRTGFQFGYVINSAPEEHSRDQVEAWRLWRKWLENRDVQDV